LRYLALGVGASVAAVVVGLLVDVAFDPTWPWYRTAIILSASLAALLIVATTSDGSGMPVAMTYDPYDARIEAEGKQMAGAPAYEPGQAGIDSLLAILPPFATAVALLFIWGF
jgi:hypothetical protein